MIQEFPDGLILSTEEQSRLFPNIWFQVPLSIQGLGFCWPHQLQLGRVKLFPKWKEIEKTHGSSSWFFLASSSHLWVITPLALPSTSVAVLAFGIDITSSFPYKGFLFSELQFSCYKQKVFCLHLDWLFFLLLLMNG